MGFAVVNGARLAWQQLGEGPDLIMVHGLAANRAFWFAHASALAAHYRVTLFDLRGHGYSDMPDTGYSASTLGRDILDLMDALRIDRAALAAHSYGGAAALEAAIAAPDRITHLALFDARVQRLQAAMRLHDLPTLSPYETAVAEASGRAYGYDWEHDEQVGFRFLEATARLRVDALDEGLRDPFTPFGEGRGAVRAARQWLRLLDHEGVREELVRPGSDADTIAQLPMPVLLMYAGDSRCLPSGAALRGLLPRARYVELPSGGHFFPAAEAASVIDRLRELLDSGPAPTA